MTNLFSLLAGLIFGLGLIVSGMTNPVASQEGLGRIIGELYPAAHFLVISRGIFAKALGFGDLLGNYLVLLITIPILLTACVLLLKKQET